MYIHVNVYIYIYIYIYMERERDAQVSMPLSEIALCVGFSQILCFSAIGKDFFWNTVLSWPFPSHSSWNWLCLSSVARYSEEIVWGWGRYLRELTFVNAVCNPESMLLCCAGYANGAHAKTNIVFWWSSAESDNHKSCYKRTKPNLVALPSQVALQKQTNVAPRSPKVNS